MINPAENSTQLLLKVGSRDDIEIIDEDRYRITVDLQRLTIGASFGDRGVMLADTWRRLNEYCWGGGLDPCPIWLLSTFPWGRAIGNCVGNRQGRTLRIQLKAGESDESLRDVLLHEMIHQFLLESRQNTKHNAQPWCDEIMRLTQLLWGKEIWAAPARSTSRKGKTCRVQRRSPKGTESISRKKIASWPHSLGLRVNLSQLEGVSQ